jgi:deoxyribose-phosphate aldolase
MATEPPPHMSPLVLPDQALAEVIAWLTPQRLTALIDATDLKADTPGAKIRQVAEWAIEHRCCSVCVNPVEVDLLPDLLRGSGVRECYVIDFPLGKSPIDLKAQQAAWVVERSRQRRGEGPGWVELDMVINVGRFREDTDYTRREVAAVVAAADGESVKVIIRSSELLPEEIVAACRAAVAGGARFVKNSTGMESFGATPEHIRLMRETVGPDVGVKAAGGIREVLDVVRLICAGAAPAELRTPERFRIGTSSFAHILAGLEQLKSHST